MFKFIFFFKKQASSKSIYQHLLTAGTGLALPETTRIFKSATVKAEKNRIKNQYRLIGRHGKHLLF
ncbi:MAG: hypothetical protein J7539_11130 [Niabella sp.]|nr:hypothetical protein [Niabella sp.]